MAQAAYSEGNALFVDEMFEEAVEAYGRALAAVEGGDAAVTKLAVLEKRAAAHLNAGDHMAALTDANAALKLDPSSLPALYRKGLACFHMDEFETAQTAFNQAVEAAPAGHRKVAVYKKWLRKCAAELESDDEDIAEAIKRTEAANAAAAAAATATVPAAAAASAAPASAPAVAAPEAGVPAASAAAAAPAQRAARAPSSRTLASAVRYDWYESAVSVTIDVMSKSIKQEASEVNFTPTSLEVNLSMQDGSNYVLDVDLAGRIVPDKCSVTYRRMKAEVKLVKEARGEWGELEGVAPAAAAPAATTSAVAGDAPEAAAPLPAPYAHKKDWSKVERDIEAELKEDKPEGEDALRTLFQQIYKDANEDTRRAMIKSFQTSGGTVLSTNWGEVASQDYEKNRQAPEGMEWKKWG